MLRAYVEPVGVGDPCSSAMRFHRFPLNHAFFPPTWLLCSSGTQWLLSYFWVTGDHCGASWGLNSLYLPCSHSPLRFCCLSGHCQKAAWTPLASRVHSPLCYSHIPGYWCSRQREILLQVFQILSFCTHPFFPFLPFGKTCKPSYELMLLEK